MRTPKTVNSAGSQTPGPEATDIRFDSSVVSNRTVVLEPVGGAFERDRVYNPAAVVHNGRLHLIYRAEGKGTGTGVLALVISDDGVRFERYSGNPVLRSASNEHGVEDPRVARFGDDYHLFFISVKDDKPVGQEPVRRASVQMAESADLVHWERRGEIISPRQDWESKQVKAPVPVPAKMAGRYWLYYQGEKEAWKTKTGLAFSTDLAEWEQLPEPVLEPREGHFDAWGVEPGVAAVVPRGILLIYAGWGGEGTHRNEIGWVLFDRDDPGKVLGRCKKPMLSLTDGHLFVDALVQFKGQWHLYYGVRDKWIEQTTLDLKRLVGQ